jgi:hypothetical protein
MDANLLGFENAHDEAIDVIPTIKAVICFPISIIVATRYCVGAFVGSILLDHQPSDHVKKSKENRQFGSEFATTEMLADDVLQEYPASTVETYSHTP